MMRRSTSVLVVLAGAASFLANVHAEAGARLIRKAGDVPSHVPPSRDAETQLESEATSLEEVAERAESKLVNQAETAGEMSALAAVPANDLCVNATAISGQGTFNFDNAMANQDGGAHNACSDPLEPVGTMDHDVWYCWTSPCTGPVIIETCSQTTVDTKVAVYDGCTCPGTSANLLGCNDDGCGTGSFLQSRRTFAAVSGQSYLVRVGTYPGDIGDPNNPIDDLPPAPGGVGTFTLTCLTPPCNQADTNCQDIKANTGSLSDRSFSQVADNFTPLSSGTITNVCWWGSYISDNPTAADNFRIRYFTNTASNLPGSLINIVPFQQPVTLNVTGPVETVVPGAGFPIFEYSATHAGIPVVAGQTYWIEITNDPVGDDWFWQQGFGSDRLALQDGSKPGQTTDVINGYTAADQIASDMAFCPGIAITQPPPNPCLTATNSCCASSATERGCNNQTCCEAVCACDPFCCNVTWDINCATTGLEGNCGAQLTCPGLCAGCPEGTIAFTDPLDCNVDAGQPHALNNAGATEGITQLTFTGPSGADNESCWSVSAPNTVQNIVDNGNGTFTMLLTAPMAVLSETTITYLSDGNVSQANNFISHPGNVDGGGATDTADATALINCCFQQSCVPAHGLYSCDINRSGVRTAEDLTRLMDLLNGGNAFGLWNQSQKPATMCP